MSDKVLYRGKLFQILSRSKESRIQVDGEEVSKNLTFELVRRPPGVRAIIQRDGKVMLNKEYRYEIEDWDYRLPGGKVFDRLEDFEKAIEEHKVEEGIYGKLAEEVCEEADIKVKDFRLFGVSGCGMTVEWDLYYFVIEDFEILPSFYSGKKQKSEYEYISHQWVGFDEIKKLILSGKFREDRSISMLCKYMWENE